MVDGWIGDPDWSESGDPLNNDWDDSQPEPEPEDRQDTVTVWGVPSDPVAIAWFLDMWNWINPTPLIDIGGPDLGDLGDEGGEHDDCPSITVTAPDGTEHQLPPGYTLFDPGNGSAPGEMFMVAPNGSLEVTSWGALEAAQNHQALSESADEVAGTLGVSSLALVRWAPIASAILAAAGLLASTTAPAHVQPVGAGDGDVPCGEE